VFDKAFNGNINHEMDLVTLSLKLRIVPPTVVILALARIPSRGIHRVEIISVPHQ